MNRQHSDHSSLPYYSIDVGAEHFLSALKLSSLGMSTFCIEIMIPHCDGISSYAFPEFMFLSLYVTCDHYYEPHC